MCHLSGQEAFFNCRVIDPRPISYLEHCMEAGLLNSKFISSRVSFPAW